ncbi:MAG: zinc ABC transporter substrate-binding protein [Commensalibacter sp.]|nr:zinc ABC transporter substrate-binding protein [Commensalibacter sp.]
MSSIAQAFYKKIIIYIALFISLLWGTPLFAKPIFIVAAENMYGDIAKQIGKVHVDVTTILSNPDQDPHSFELTPSVGYALTKAQLVIINGVGYDAWADRLLSHQTQNRPKIILAQDILGKKMGDNPHLWYDIDGMQKLSQYLAKQYIDLMPENRNLFEANLAQFSNQLTKIKKRIETIKSQHLGLFVAATEPVCGIMVEKLGFEMGEQNFQWVIMNGGEPSPRQVAQFEDDLRQKKIKLLFYNAQVITPETDRLKQIANQANIPIIGVSETMPEGMSYQQWMNDTLSKIEAALPKIKQ